MTENVKIERLRMQLKNPDLLEIDDASLSRVAYGPDQEWFEDEHRKISGCGPTAAALQTAYLALSHDALRSLYPGNSTAKPEIVSHMNTMFEKVTPGFMGLNRLSLYNEGLLRYAAEKNVQLVPHLFDVQGISRGNRNDLDLLGAFLEAGLAADCPIAFLALSSGQEKRLQTWHWITITEAEFLNGSILAVASDEGKKIEFDVGLWYRTTPLSGGMVYYTAA